MASKRHVVVIGAGVTGLTSAVFLAEAGYEVTIVAAHVPGDESIEYTSPWAGAHWNAAGTPEEPMKCDWEVQTYDYWIELLEREARDSRLPKSGLKMQDSYHFYDGNPGSHELWWSPHVKNFAQVSLVTGPILRINRSTPEHLPKVQSGVVARKPSINVPVYLAYLRQKAEALGVKVFKERLPLDDGLEKALSAAADVARKNGRRDVDCFVNATGLAARRLCGDEAVYPIRGQTVLVKGEAIATRTRMGDEYTYCIPRPGSDTTILGGVKEKGRWNEEVEEKTTNAILEKNRYLAPELLTGPDGDFEVISTQCGLRPGREGGARMEKEVVGGKKVVHAYGHGGGGYQESVGSARLVVKMVTESTGGSHIFARL